MAQRAWICFEDEAGQMLRPPKARTWARCGHIPVVTVTGKGSGRVSIAGLLCLKQGHRGRLMYRTLTHRGRKGEPSSSTEADYIALLDTAHQRLDAPIVLVWDNLNTHVSKAMRDFIDGRDWLTVIRLPAYAPDLNPTEGVWSNLKRGIANLTAHGVDHLARTVKRRLRRWVRSVAE
ncbi:transposase [Dactylosporangium cerinum]|uniref:Transposase n=1 Tax=Dactylosporangium cerinum TaxID=1434730 RepID=A0ABV9WEH9_9ACTN